MNKRLLPLLGAALLPALTQCNTLEKDIAGINARNAELQKLADGVNVFFIDCNPIFDDAGGALRADYSGDGVHVKAAYYPLWRDYLFRFGVVR